MKRRGGEAEVRGSEASGRIFLFPVYLVVVVCVDGLPFVLSQHVRSLYTFWQRYKRARIYGILCPSIQLSGGIHQCCAQETTTYVWYRIHFSFSSPSTPNAQIPLPPPEMSCLPLFNGPHCPSAAFHQMVQHLYNIFQTFFPHMFHRHVPETCFE